MLGTNPLSVAIPGGKHPDFVVDMATSVVAKGKVNLAEKLGKPIPKGWIIDKEGRDTENPADIGEGALLPFGGVKGYAIGLIIDILVSCLGGGKRSVDITSFFSGKDPEGFRNVGFLFAAIDVSAFVEIEVFSERIAKIFEAINACPPASGFSEVMVPGAIEHRSTLDAERKGVDLPEAVVSELRMLSEEHGLKFRW